MNNPKILLFDIETTPNLAYVWAKYQQDVIAYENEWYMLSFAYKWLGEDTVKCKSLRDYATYETDKENDVELVNDLYKLFNEAELIIAHNGDDFDIKKSNARFVFHGLTPPSPYKSIDTKKIAKNSFKFNSNSLNDLGKHLKLGEKTETGGFNLWKGCMTGDADSWTKMEEYNKKDVELLEKVYLRLRPWTKTHPNLGQYSEDKQVCPKCGGTHLQSRGFSRTLASVYRRFQCQSCGGWSRSNKCEKDTRVKITNL